MPRPKIYKNAAQKKAALRIKSQRYYWNHRDRVLGRVKAYQDSQRAPQQKIHSAIQSEGLSSMDEHSSRVCPLSSTTKPDPLSEARRIYALFLNETHRSPLEFIQGLYEELVQWQSTVVLKPETSESPLARSVATFAFLLDSVTPLLNPILQAHGALDEFKEANSISSQIGAVVACLEDMECAVLVNEVRDTYNRGEYLFQQADFKNKLSGSWP
ncbi:hypothetical protein V5O48_014792 [Marasmius crinis-equi]|uniref:Uncharacterized protein n=1 Tax=Marasmius crinis-equi TaxID=585013 RepID=A0ABR3EWA8_9AGAR